MIARHLLLWDGDCGFCRRSAALVCREDAAGVFETSPYQQAPTPPMTPELFSACSRSVHVITSDGRVLRAGRACLFILHELGHPTLARALLIPPFIWMIELGYRIVAANRPLLSRVFFRHEDL